MFACVLYAYVLEHVLCWPRTWCSVVVIFSCKNFVISELVSKCCSLTIFCIQKMLMTHFSYPKKSSWHIFRIQKNPHDTFCWHILKRRKNGKNCIHTIFTHAHTHKHSILKLNPTTWIARYKAFQLSENLRCRGHFHPAKLPATNVLPCHYLLLTS